jgi:hypothetical protein
MSNTTNPSGTAPPGSQLPEWSTPRELACRWKVHASTVHRMHRDEPDRFGRMIRGQLRIHRSDIERVESIDRAAERAKSHEAGKRMIRGIRAAQRPPTGDSAAPHRKRAALE